MLSAGSASKPTPTATPRPSDLAGSRSELIDAAGDREVTYQTPGGRVIKDAFVLRSGFGDVFNDTPQQNGVVNVSSNQYDGADRLILATLPEDGTTAYQWSSDLEQNVIQVTQTPKPGSPLSHLATGYAYDPVYNKPTRITDPLGLVATMQYDPAICSRPLPMPAAPAISTRRKASPTTVSARC